MSAAAMVPFGGIVATGLRLSKRLGKLFKLTPTHALTKSKRAFAELKADIAKNGVKDPIKYVEHNGQQYIVDGHHRARAAKELGIKEVPGEQVQLPFRGYKSVDDLFNP